MTSAGMASILDVGLEIGKMIGRFTAAAHGLDDVFRERAVGG